MTGRIAIITGGSKGLGANLARRFWLAGYNLGIVSKSRADLEKMANKLPVRKSQACIPLPYDLMYQIEVKKLIEEIKKNFSEVNVLINNAAIHGPIGPLESNNFSDWKRTFQVNLFAPVALCMELTPQLVAGKGAIINLSGGGATTPRPNFTAYAAAKTALVRFSETLAEELSGRGVRVNCIAPGAMKTSMIGELLSLGEIAGKREHASAIEVFKNGGASMDRVADLALFLAGGSGKNISGKLISAQWDNWENWTQHLDDLLTTDAYTLRRVTGRDRGFTWGDK